MICLIQFREIYFRISSILLLAIELLCQFTIDECKIYHLLPSQSNSCNIEADYHDCLTLPQLVINTTVYLTENTTLIFAPGRHTMELDLTVANFHTFSMLAETSPLMETEIVCCDRASFIFNNVTAVTVNGFRFSECKGNEVNSVHQFHLTKSTFYGGFYCGRILTIVESVSYLDRVSLLFHSTDSEQHVQCSENVNHTATMPTEPDFCTDHVILYTDASIVTIMQSLFKGPGNHRWMALYSQHGSEISISSSTFTQNPGNYAYYDGNLHVTSKSTIYLYACMFQHCRGHTVLTAVDAIVKITHSLFLNNLPSICVLGIADSISYITHNLFINNSKVLRSSNTSLLRISHNGFIENDQSLLVLDGGIISVDCCDFINNAAKSGEIISVERTKQLSIQHNKFRNNEVFLDIVNIWHYSTGMKITNNEFIETMQHFMYTSVQIVSQD